MSPKKADPTRKTNLEKRTPDSGRRKTRQSHRSLNRTIQSTLAGSQVLDPAGLLELQQAAGNQAVHNLLSARLPTPPTSQLPAAACRLISEARGGGNPLPAPLRSHSGTAAGARIHTDARADHLAHALGAAAFTSGPDIFFRRGQYDPHSPPGRKLLSHELEHVTQQGARHSAYHLKLGPENDRLEQQAEQASRSPARTTPTPQPSSGVSASVQRFKFPWQKKIPDSPTLTDKNVTGSKIMGGGSLNEVSMVNRSQPSSPGGKGLGFFKANRSDEEMDKLESGKSHKSLIHNSNPKQGSTMAAKAVGSSRLNQWLGLDALADETFAEHKGEAGSESAQVAGKPLMEHEFKSRHENQNPNVVMKDQSKWKDGARYARSGTKFMKHDFTNPETQKGMSNIQLMDSITGQRDRHGGNMYIDPKTGKTKGIDNDLAFSEGFPVNLSRMEGMHKNPKARDEVNYPSFDNKYLGMPTHIDEATAKSVLKHKAKNLPKVLNSPDNPQKLTDEEIKETQERYRTLKQYVKDVKKGKVEGARIVGKEGWGKETYAEQMNAPRKKALGGGYTNRTLLQRSADDLEKASGWKNKGQKAELQPTNKLFTSSLQAGGHRFASAKPQAVPAPAPWHSGPQQVPEPETMPQPIQHQLTGIQHQAYEETLPQKASYSASPMHTAEVEEMPKPQLAEMR